MIDAISALRLVMGGAARGHVCSLTHHPQLDVTAQRWSGLTPVFRAWTCHVRRWGTYVYARGTFSCYVCRRRSNTDFRSGLSEDRRPSFAAACRCCADGNTQERGHRTPTPSRLPKSTKKAGVRGLNSNDVKCRTSRSITWQSRATILMGAGLNTDGWRC